MSMLSAQCDKLRAMAESVGLAMPQAATLMMEAADTIWELRESVHRERSEADRLRKLVHRMHGHIKEACDVCDGWYCSNFDEDNECCVYDTLARELGVEVDK